MEDCKQIERQDLLNKTEDKDKILAAEKIWSDCMFIISRIIDKDSVIDNWFKPIKAVAYDKPKLTIELASDFVRQYIEEKYIDVVNFALEKIIGEDFILKFNLRIVDGEKPLSQEASKSPIRARENKRIETSVNTKTAKEQNSEGSNTKPNSFQTHLNPDYSFDSLIQGECNKLGIKTGIEISNNPGNSPFNPLYIFGDSGLGKTHLAQAIGLEVSSCFPMLKVLYITATEFQHQYMYHVGQNNRLTDFLSFYNSIDLLIVDDIQFLSGSKTQQAMFNIFDFLHNNNKQLIFISDRSPSDLEKFEARLVSRLKWGLSVRLDMPDYKTRLSVIKFFCKKNALLISDDIIELIAREVEANFRELQGLMTALLANSIHGKKDLNIDDTRSYIMEFCSKKKQSDLNIKIIIKEVAEHFCLSPENLQSNSRKREIVMARQIAMYLAKKRLNLSYISIGEDFGGKDHSTVIYACKNIDSLISLDKSLKQSLRDIDKRLLQY